MRQCAPPRLAHSLHRTRLRPHSAIRIRTEHVSCELLAATHTHNTLHCTCTFLHSAHSKRVMIFLDTASTTHAPRASSRFSHALRASTALYCTRIRNRERKWLHLCSLLRWHCNLTLCTVFLLAQDRRQQMDRAIFLLRPFRRESIWSSARSQASSSDDDRLTTTGKTGCESNGHKTSTLGYQVYLVRLLHWVRNRTKILPSKFYQVGTLPVGVPTEQLGPPMHEGLRNPQVFEVKRIHVRSA